MQACKAGIWGQRLNEAPLPDFASLHPGYESPLIGRGVRIKPDTAAASFYFSTNARSIT